jgi:hypothetical protein
MATGWPLLFNHLQAHHLEKISCGEMNRFCGLLEKQYGIHAEAEALFQPRFYLPKVVRRTQEPYARNRAVL